MPQQISDVTHTIQLAVAPVFLLTALGTLLGVVSVRLGRIVDRVRFVQSALKSAPAAEQGFLVDEARSLSRRRKLVHRAIISFTTAALFVCVLIASAFLASLLSMDAGRVVAGLFIAAMFAFISGLLFYLREILLAVESARIRPIA